MRELRNGFGRPEWVAPPIPPEGRAVYAIWEDLDRMRGGEWAPEPVRLRDVREYQKTFSLRFSLWTIRMILMIDLCYRAAHQKARQKDA